MSRKRILALAIFLAAAVVLVMLQLHHRQRSDSPEPSRSMASSSSGTDGSLANPSGTDEAARTALTTSAVAVPAAAPSASATGLRVRSAEGLALSFVEVEDEPGRWRDVALVDGACDPTTLRLPCNVRAPGHVPGTAIRLEDEVVLQADALLVLEGSDLRNCVVSIAPFPWLAFLDTDYAPSMRERFARLETHGFTSTDRWAIAVSGDGLGESFGYRHELEVHVEDRNYRLIVVEFRATRGARGSWTVPCDARLPVAPLDVAIVRPADAVHGELVCNLHIYAERDVLRELPQSWGRVVLQPGLRFTREGRVPANEDRWHLADVPLREHAVLTVMDQESQANGRLFFVHDGTPQRIELRAGFTLTGRIAVPAGTALPTRMNMCFGRPADPPDRQARIEAFSSDMRDVPIATDGAFEVRGPQRVPLWREISAEPPVELALQIEARGFEIHSSRWPLGAATRVDCGTLVLVPSSAPIVLAPGHGFRAETLDWMTLRSGTGPKDWWTIRCGRREVDTSLALVLDREWLARNDPDARDAAKDALEIERAHAERPSSIAIEALVVDIGSDWGRAFVRGADGRYERVEERDYTIEAAASAVVEPDSQLTIGWQWRGIPQRLVTLGPGRAGQRNTLRFVAPRDGVHLWWSSAREADRGTADREAQSVELTSASATVEIP